jgi:hypothetical protein
MMSENESRHFYTKSTTARMEKFEQDVERRLGSVGLQTVRSLMCLHMKDPAFVAKLMQTRPQQQVDHPVDDPVDDPADDVEFQEDDFLEHIKKVPRRSRKGNIDPPTSSRLTWNQFQAVMRGTRLPNLSIVEAFEKYKCTGVMPVLDKRSMLRQQLLLGHW